MFGNLLVMSAVLRRKEMRTARNIFIFNLALSDFLLATSIPFTVFDALTRAWPLPYSWIGCRWKFKLLQYEKFEFFSCLQFHKHNKKMQQTLHIFERLSFQSKHGPTKFRIRFPKNCNYSPPTPSLLC